jgi:hypothetical protein
MITPAGSGNGRRESGCGRSDRSCSLTPWPGRVAVGLPRQRRTARRCPPAQKARHLAAINRWRLAPGPQHHRLSLGHGGVSLRSQSLPRCRAADRAECQQSGWARLKSLLLFCVRGTIEWHHSVFAKRRCRDSARGPISVAPDSRHLGTFLPGLPRVAATKIATATGDHA